MPPAGDTDDDGLTREQWRRLAILGVAIGALTVLGIVSITAASHQWGIGGGQDGPPSAAFSVETDADRDGVAANVTHEGGDGIHPPHVRIVVNGEDRGSWNGLGGGGADVVTPGARLVLDDVEPGDEVRVVYEDGDDRAVLGRGTVDDV